MRRNRVSRAVARRCRWRSAHDAPGDSGSPVAGLPELLLRPAVAATLGVSMALFDDNRTIVAGIDATPDGLAAMKAGELKVTVFQNASGQGKSAVDMALKLVPGGKVEGRVWVPFELVTSANLANYLNKH
jgi:ABC-type sugar transport system substrate-binding protein